MKKAKILFPIGLAAVTLLFAACSSDSSTNASGGDDSGNSTSKVFDYNALLARGCAESNVGEVATVSAENSQYLCAYLSDYGVYNWVSVYEGDVEDDLTCDANYIALNPTKIFVYATDDYSIYTCTADDWHGVKSPTFILPTRPSNTGYKGRYGILTDARDGQTYKTVQVGTMTWMAQNLNYEPPTGGSVCYDNDINNCATRGRLYNWAAAMDSIYQGGCGYESSCSIVEPHRGVCPEGWHLPSRAEWVALLEYIEVNQNFDTDEWEGIAPSLLAEEGWMVDYDNDNGVDTTVAYYGLNTYGLSIVPAGEYAYNRLKFEDLNSITSFWTSTPWGTS